jgi:ComF family protein
LQQFAGVATSTVEMGGGWAAIALDVLLPRACAACDAPLPLGHRSALCSACWASIRMPAGFRCDRCGIPLPLDLPTCPPCTARPPAYDTARALGLYLARPGFLNPLARAVRALKFHGHRAAGSALGAGLARLLPPNPSGARPVIVAVPLHVDRLRERGYNQALLLARALARATGLRLAPNALARVRATPSQAHLDAPARRANLAGAFAAHDDLAGTPVVLVDDVLTTGATADACAGALRRAGASRVDVIAVGRTP